MMTALVLSLLLAHGPAAAPFSDGRPVNGAAISPSYVAIGTSTSAARLHLLSEASASTPTDFDANDLVVGRAAVTGASSGAIFFRYNSSLNVGVIGCLSPAVAWRKCLLVASNFAIQNASAQEVFTVGASGDTMGFARFGGHQFMQHESFAKPVQTAMD